MVMILGTLPATLATVARSVSSWRSGALSGVHTQAQLLQMLISVPTSLCMYVPVLSQTVLTDIDRGYDCIYIQRNSVSVFLTR